MTVYPSPIAPINNQEVSSTIFTRIGHDGLRKKVLPKLQFLPIPSPGSAQNMRLSVLDQTIFALSHTAVFVCLFAVTPPITLRLSIYFRTNLPIRTAISGTANKTGRPLQKERPVDPYGIGAVNRPLPHPYNCSEATDKQYTIRSWRYTWCRCRSHRPGHRRPESIAMRTVHNRCCG